MFFMLILNIFCRISHQLISPGFQPTTLSKLNSTTIVSDGITKNFKNISRWMLLAMRSSAQILDSIPPTWWSKLKVHKTFIFDLDSIGKSCVLTTQAVFPLGSNLSIWNIVFLIMIMSSDFGMFLNNCLY